MPRSRAGSVRELEAANGVETKFSVSACLAEALQAEPPHLPAPPMWRRNQPSIWLPPTRKGEPDTSHCITHTPHTTLTLHTTHTHHNYTHIILYDRFWANGFAHPTGLWDSAPPPLAGSGGRSGWVPAGEGYLHRQGGTQGGEKYEKEEEFKLSLSHTSCCRIRKPFFIFSID